MLFNSAPASPVVTTPLREIMPFGISALFSFFNVPRLAGVGDYLADNQSSFWDCHPMIVKWMNYVINPTFRKEAHETKYKFK